MDSKTVFSEPAVLWFIIGLVFLLLELPMPGVIIVFFGVGAWITALVCLFIDISLNLQLVIFIIASLLSLILLRKYLRQLLYKEKITEDTLEDEFIGKTAVADTDIVPGKQGKVNFKGTTWNAVSDTKIKKGESAQIIGKDSITLKIKSLKTKS